MKFEHKTLKGFSRENLEEIKFYTFKNGMARPIFENARKNKLKNPSEFKLTLLRHDKGFLIGWSLFVEDWARYGHDSKEESLLTGSSYMCFVRPLFRKMGYGRKLWNASNACLNKDVVVFGWDDRSKQFYNALAKDNSVVIA